LTEIVNLQKLREELSKAIVHISSKMALYEDDDEKYAKLAYILHRLSKSLLDCEILERNPRLLSADTSNNSLASLMKRVYEEEEKTPLQTLDLMAEDEGVDFDGDLF